MRDGAAQQALESSCVRVWVCVCVRGETCIADNETRTVVNAFLIQSTVHMSQIRVLSMHYTDRKVRRQHKSKRIYCAPVASFSVCFTLSNAEP